LRAGVERSAMTPTQVVQGDDGVALRQQLLDDHAADVPRPTGD